MTRQTDPVNRYAGSAAPMTAVSMNLDACYEECRRLTKLHGSTYYFSARFFPKEIRRSIFGLYGFVRVPDEIVDNPEEDAADAESQRRVLLAWGERFDRALLTGESDHPVMHAFIDTLNRHRIPVEYPLAFLESMLMDVTVRRYATFEDLAGYTHGSASVIGLMICSIVGLEDPAALPYAADLGLAMQLTNFLRDVGEDYRERGRIYLPLEDLHRFGYSEQDLAAGIVDDRWVRLMQFQIARNREIYRRAELGIPYLPEFARYPIRLAGRLYAAILERIEANGYDVFSRRARTSKPFKLWTAVTMLASSRVHAPVSLVRVADRPSE
ncbi:MAG: phytoene/squalene synthase family protein [Dehalococcoidia bacterium]